MRYLEDKFKDELDQGSLTDFDDGILKISGVAFESRQILEAASANQIPPTILDQAFDAWVQDFVAGQIELADGILEEGDQFARFSALQNKFNKDRIVPFVGAGLSIDSGYPKWRDFLLSLRNDAGIDEADLLLMLNSNQYEETAEKLAGAMSKPLFSERISSTYGVPKSPTGVVRLLPDLFNSHVLTTNFDHVLRDVYRSSNMPFAKECLGCDAANIRHSMSEGSVLVKLHGHADHGVGRVFTQTDYENHYEQGDRLNDLLDVFVNQYGFLFLGCSLSIDRPIRALRNLVEQKGYDNMPKHYAFLARPESEQTQRDRTDELSHHHIYPIWFPEGMYEESISALLIKLREDRA